jgi:uncharacterized repeat protein (TIGR02543 family)
MIIKDFLRFLSTTGLSQTQKNPRYKLRFWNKSWSKCVIPALSVCASVFHASGQAPGLLWQTNVGARLFAVDSQTNVYANLAGTIIQMSGDGVPFQTNVLCSVTNGIATNCIARLDSLGNFYLIGSFEGTQDFGGITLVGGSSTVGQPGYPTCYVAKYAGNGSLQWVIPLRLYDNCVHRAHDLVINQDGSFLVAYDSCLFGELAEYSSSLNQLWRIELSHGPPEQNATLAVKALTDTNGCFLQYRTVPGSPSYIIGGFYDSAGNLTYYQPYIPSGPLYPPRPTWYNRLALNGRPVVGLTNDGYFASLSSQQPVLQKTLTPYGSVVWTQALGSAEAWALAGDSAGNLFLSDTNGLFSKYDGNGTLIWSTNYGLPVVSMLLNAQGNRFISFTDNSIARLASDPAPQAPGISANPQSQTVFVGDNVTFSVTANGTPPFHYFWQLNGTNISNGLNPSLTLNSITVAGAGLYSVVVTNAAGGVTSSPPALLRVKSVELYAGSRLLTNGTYTFPSPLTLTVRSAFPGASAFYTLDGTTPNFSSAYYSGPFNLSHSATVRAIGYSADFSQSEEADPINAIVLVNHKFSIVASAGGTVNLNPPGGTYFSTNVVTATASPTPGSSFLYWLGDAIGTNPLVNISMDRDKVIQAVFGTTLSTTVAGNGQVILNPPGGLYPYGTVVQLTGIPSPGNYFGFWGNAATGNTNPLYFTINSPTQTVSSIFGALAVDQAALTVQINGHGRATVNPRANAFSTNQSVTLTALPYGGQTFAGWSGDATGTQNPITVLMDRSRVVTANFSNKPLLRANRAGLEGLTADGFRFTIITDPQSTWQILGSSNLTVWETIGSVTPTFDETQFNDPAANSLLRRFYSVKPLP